MAITFKMSKIMLKVHLIGLKMELKMYLANSLVQEKECLTVGVKVA